MIDVDETFAAEVAAHVAKRYRGIHSVEFEDLQQEVLLWWHSEKTQAELARLMECDPYSVRWKAFRNAVRAVAGWAEKQKALAGRYDQDDQYRYSPAVVEVVLETVFYPDNQLGAAQMEPDKVKSMGDPRSSVDIVAMAADVSWALPQLTDAQRSVIEAWMRGDVARYAAGRGVDEGSARRALDRALERVADLLNWYRGDGLRPPADTDPGRSRVDRPRDGLVAR